MKGSRKLRGRKLEVLEILFISIKQLQLSTDYYKLLFLLLPGSENTVHIKAQSKLISNSTISSR